MRANWNFMKSCGNLKVCDRKPDLLQGFCITHAADLGMASIFVTPKASSGVDVHATASAQQQAGAQAGQQKSPR
jgi:hypothetical protein